MTYHLVLAIQQFQHLLIARVVSFEVMPGQGIHETCRSFCVSGFSFIEGCDYL